MDGFVILVDEDAEHKEVQWRAKIQPPVSLTLKHEYQLCGSAFAGLPGSF